mmetsp:Transcript_1821/g.3295  ORF Transcript_1821/g.3295 Transcript_1821/m.3295 type:complete len:101 (+) Transcript_1821:276-578(+)
MSATSASGKANLPQGDQCSNPLEESSSDLDLVLSDDDDADLIDGAKADSLQEKKAAEDLVKKEKNKTKSSKISLITLPRTRSYGRMVKTNISGIFSIMLM